MTDIIIDFADLKKVMIEMAYEINPDLAKMENEITQLVLKNISETPAVAIPRRDVIYLHGKIPEDYIEMVITHETLHIVVQKLCGYVPDKPEPFKAHTDAVVDSPVFNMLLCLTFGMKPLKFIKWLHLATTPSFFGRLLFRLLYLATKDTYIKFINIVKVMWDEE